MPAALRIFRAACALTLAVSALLYIPLTLHWPLVGDASLIHYIAFLTERGWAPYRQLGDMNLPGSYLVELAAMHLFGPGPLAWRLFDVTLLALSTAATFAILTRRYWFPALAASALFILIHGRDGLAQGGQRDLTMAVALLAATACLAVAQRIGNLTPAAVFLFGLFSGLAASLKPTAAILTTAQLALALRQQPRTNRLRLAALTLAGYLIAPAACLVFLLHEHALRAFLEGLHTVVPYYNSLGHRPIGYILTHSFSPIEPLAGLWLAILALSPACRALYRTTTHQLLAAGVLFGLTNCLLQHRALPYYRYPLLAFLLPLLFLDLVAAAERLQKLRVPKVLEAQQADPGADSPRLARAVGPLARIGLAYAALWIAPQSIRLIHSYRYTQLDMQSALERSLDTLGGSGLSGHIQCIDSVSGCNSVLYRMRLEPATGVLSDFLLFGNSTDALPPAEIPVIRDTRAQLLAAFNDNPPRVVIVTSHLHMTGPEDFGKLARWPALATLLDTRYALAQEWRPTRPERWWSRNEYPAAFRIYVLRSPLTPPPPIYSHVEP